MAGGSAERDSHRPPETALEVSLRGWDGLLGPTAILLAITNVLFGLLFRRDASSSTDFVRVLAWSGEWLRGLNPYAPPDASVDYPPNAFVTLAPLAAITLTQAAALWTALHVLLTASIGLMATRLATFGHSTLLFAGLVMALPPFRIVMQFSIASFAPALAGFLLADRHPRLAGAAIGFSLMKPHIGGPFLLWAIAARRWTTVSVALATPLALLAVFAARSMDAPHTVIWEWLQALAREQNRPDIGAGETNLQPLLAWIGLPPVAVQALLAAVLCAGLIAIWMRQDDDFDLRFAGAACLLSLLSFRHLSYNLLLAIPVLAFAASRAGRAGPVIAACAFAVLIASPPSIWRHYVEPGFMTTALEPIALHAYRIAALAMFLFAVTWRERPQKHGGTI